MTRILKAKIEFTDVGEDNLTTVHLPAGARFISAINQREGLVVYAECPNRSNAVHQVLVAGTGHAHDLSGWRFLSTVSFDGGNSIFHVYARGK